MNKLLKQLVQVLDENGITIDKLDIKDSIEDYRITVNDTATFKSSPENFTITYGGKEDNKVFVTASLTSALDRLSTVLKLVGEGDTLKSGNGVCTYTVVKNHVKDMYNLLDTDTNQLLYLNCTSKGYIQSCIDKGLLIKE